MITSTKQFAFFLKFITVIVLSLLIFNVQGQSKQNNPGDKIVTIPSGSQSVKEIFKSITNQTGLRFSYNNSDFNQNERVSTPFVDIAVDKILRHIFAGKAMSWVYIDNVVRIGKSKKDQEPSIIIEGRSSNKTIDSVPIIDVKGKVVDPGGRPIAGATVSLRGQNRGQGTNIAGGFIFTAIPANTILLVSSIGFESRQYRIAGQKEITIKLDSLIREIQGVDIVSTGYQDLPRERAAGSFSKIDNKMLNQQVSSDILSRLDGMASGLSFQSKRYGSLEDVMIRGRATFSNYTPLVVVDNFPYEGDINNINPNDVESVTILKDASAASIWGARAGNGVIVITTKKGNYNRRLNIQLSSNLTFSDKPDLFYSPQMSVSDYVSLERIFFDKGMYNDLEQSIFHSAVSPVGELLIAKRDGLLTPGNADSQITALAGRADIRNDYLKHFYKKQLVQRHSLNLNGGSANYNYFMSLGYDRNMHSLTGNKDDRISLNFRNSYMIAKNLEVSASVLYSRLNSSTTTDLTEAQYPYEKLMDDAGNPLPITRTYRTTFIKDAFKKGLLDWEYRPLAEREALDRSNISTDYLMNATINYHPVKDVGVMLLYQHEEQSSSGRDRSSQELYETRNLINQFTQVAANGTITRPVPLGDILSTVNQKLNSNSLRFQLSYNGMIGDKSSVNAIAGAEVRETSAIGNSNTVYGYADDGLTSVPVNYVTSYPLYTSSFTSSAVPYGASNSDVIRRYISYYGNASYTWDNRLSVTASARRDGANLFGVNSNKKWKPLWSTGLAWTISNEPFYKIEWLPYLKLRATYGHTGSIGSASAYLTAVYRTSSFTGLKTATITQPPNPDLRWEQQGIVNLAVDFSIKNKILTGSIEYYSKKGTDLILNAPIDPSIGFYAGANYSALRNYASIHSKGLDVDLNSTNIQGVVSWQSRFIFSYTKNKILTVANNPTISDYLSPDGAVIQGKSFGEIFSYRWGGLDHTNGNPIGYIDDKPSTDYLNFSTQSKPGDLVDNGSSTPVFFGSLQNSFSWRNFLFSIGVNYKMGYYFRRNSFLFSVGNNHRDFASRWQKPGDEAITNVPSIPEQFSQARNSFYSLSEVLVEKADHIRLQFINVGYNISRDNLKRLPVRNVQLFANIANLGILWKANKQDIDPDYLYGIPPSVSTTFGAKIEF